MRRAIFIDLQGTLGGEGLGDIRSFTPFPFAAEALATITNAGFLAVIVTNQTRIEEGLFTRNFFDERMRKHIRDLERAGGRVTAVYVCPHVSGSTCRCRKPRTGMLDDAAADYDIDVGASFVVGDWGNVDMAMAQSAGCGTILVRTGVGESSLGEFRHTWAEIIPDFIAADLRDASNWIAAQS